MMRVRVLYVHPKITLISSIEPSAVSLYVEMGFDRGVGSWVESGLQKVCIARGVAAAIRDEPSFSKWCKKTMWKEMGASATKMVSCSSTKENMQPEGG